MTRKKEPTSLQRARKAHADRLKEKGYRSKTFWASPAALDALAKLVAPEQSVSDAVNAALILAAEEKALREAGARAFAERIVLDVDAGRIVTDELLRREALKPVASGAPSSSRTRAALEPLDVQLSRIEDVVAEPPRLNRKLSRPVKPPQGLKRDGAGTKVDLPVGPAKSEPGSRLKKGKTK